MVVINHGTSEATRLAMAMPVYYWLSRWFVERGYVVVLPQRRGHGATGGDLDEARDTCANPDHFASGNSAADDIENAIRFMSAQDFVAEHGAIVVGISSGGWASLALAARDLTQVARIVNFAGGRGGHAHGSPHRVCGPERLIEASRRLGLTAHTPTLWLYARNDSYFAPELASAMHEAWAAAGGGGELRILAAYGAEGHDLVDDQAGWYLWGEALETFLMTPAPVRAASGPPDRRRFAGKASPASAQ
jgi:dienelactone hydrolase